jgi:hypothetical protein
MAEETAAKAAPKLLLFHYAILGAVIQVDFPPKFRNNEGGFTEIERSCEGSVHFRPNSTVMLTESEKAYLDKQEPDVARRLLFVAVHESVEQKTERMRAASAAVHVTSTQPLTSTASGSGALGSSSESSEEDPKPSGPKGKGSKSGG